MTRLPDRHGDDLPRSELAHEPFEDWLDVRHEQLLAGRDDAGEPILAPPMIESADRCLRVLEKLRRANLALEKETGNSDDTLIPDDRLRPRRIGRFEVRRELGRGAAGLVLLAFDPQLGRDIALKVPSPAALATESLCQRFVREAEAAARLTHPNVVAVYEVGREGVLTYIASEYCAGGTLTDWIAAQHPVDYRVAAQMFVAIADGLHHAHTRGILHRDVKPGNVVLSLVDAQTLPVPKLTDFGLAKLVGEDLDLTRTGAIMGTAGYMAPEQANGAVRDIGVWTDVFSFGCMLYEALTLRAPFAGGNRTETLVKLLTQDVEPPDRWRTGIPADLAAICLKCLEKDPARRYSSAAEVADDLNRFLQGAPTKARPLSVLNRLGRWSDRHRGALAAAAVVTLTAAVSLFAVVGSRLRLAETMENLSRVAESEARVRQETGEWQRVQQYAADMSIASESWRTGDALRTRSLLAQYVPQAGQANLRTLPWAMLDRWANFRENELLYQHKAPAHDIAVSRDGRWIASAGADQNVILWDARESRIARTLTAHTDQVNSVSFSPDGRWLASAGDDATVRIWSLEEDLPPRVLSGMAQEGIHSVEFSPAGSRLAAGGLDGLVWTWETENFTLHQTLKLGAVVETLAYSPRGSDLAAGCRDLKLRTFRLRASGNLSAHKEFEFAAKVSAAAYTPDSKTWIASGFHGSLQTCPVASEAMQVFASYPDAYRVHDIAYSPDGKLLVVCDGRGRANVYESRTRRLHAMLDVGEADVWSVAFSRDGGQLLTAGHDGAIRSWDIAEIGSLAVHVAEPGAGLQDSEFSPDGSMFVGAEPGAIRPDKIETVHVYEVRSGAKLFSIATKSPHWDECFSADSRMLYLADRDDLQRCVVRRIDLVSGTELSPTLVDCDLIVHLWCPADSVTLGIGQVLSSGERIAVMVDPRTGHQHARFSLGDQGVKGTAQEGRLAIAQWDTVLGIWDCQSGSKLRDLVMRESPFGFLEISQSGRFVAYHAENRALLVDLQRGETPIYLSPTTRPTRCALSRDGDALFTGHSQSVRLFDTRAERLVMEIPEPSFGYVSLVEIAPNDKAVAIGWRRSLATGERAGELFFYCVEPTPPAPSNRAAALSAGHD